MKEKIKQLIELGFNANHRWHTVADAILENVERFDKTDTLPTIKSKLSDLHQVINQRVQSAKSPERQGDTDTDTPDTGRERAETMETDGNSGGNSNPPAGAGGESDASSVSEANRRRLMAMMSESTDTGIGTGVSGSDTDTHKTVKKRRVSEPPKPEYANMMTGYLLLVIMDMVIPSAVTYVYNNYTDKGKKSPFNASALRMEQKEIKELTPIADEVAKLIGSNMSPVTMLLIGYGSMLVGKFMQS